MKSYDGMFARSVAKRRRELGMTLEQVARKIKSHKGYVSGFENGKVAPPSLRYLKRLSRLYKFDLKKLSMMSWLEKAPAEIRTEAAILVLDWFDRNGGRPRQ